MERLVSNKRSARSMLVFVLCDTRPQERKEASPSLFHTTAKTSSSEC
jgi:hypothetical protein